MEPSASSGAYEGAFHAERIVVDGDSSTLTALLLYKAGTLTAFTLNARYILVITDIYISLESAGDAILVAGDASAAGNRIVYNASAALAVIDRSLKRPYICPAGVTPKFAGTSQGTSICIVEGYIISR